MSSKASFQFIYHLQTLSYLQTNASNPTGKEIPSKTEGMEEKERCCIVGVDGQIYHVNSQNGGVSVKQTPLQSRNDQFAPVRSLTK